MQVAIIRHGIAESRQRFARTGRPDRERPLTKEGQQKMAQVARGLAAWLERFDVIATSPLQRARQTADVLGVAFPDARLVEWSELEPDGDPARLWSKIRALKGCKRLAVVSHRPLVPNLVGWVLTGKDFPLAELKKGGVCLVELRREGPGQAVLLASLPPAVLRRLVR
jgi:phosphohistidine phosphatase